MPFFRILQHLAPRAEAWRTTIDKTLRRFFLGLAEEPARARAAIDSAWLDIFPETCSLAALNEWERHYGLSLTDTTDDDAVDDARLRLVAEWQATGGQSPAYIEGVLHAAGFDEVFVHEWWSSGPPYVARDPRDYTIIPAVGTWRCGGIESANSDPDAVDGPTCTDGAGGPRCNRFLVNDPHYLVNKDLTPRAPPPIPDDPEVWPYFVYVGGETFGDVANVSITRRAEFERLLLKLRPLHNWIVTIVEYVAVGRFITEDGADEFTTEGGDYFIAES